MVKAKIWKRMKVFDGMPKDDDVQLVEEDLPELKDEEILIETLYLTVDPYMRMTAYFGFLKICQPKEGETVVVGGAAGAVGSLVGQIAKIKGCKVIGFAGDDKKCEWLKELGFDLAYNYKKVDLDKTLKEAAPDGVDCYFDNVGGEFTSTVLKNMKEFGRIATCGQISQYNATEKNKCESPFPLVLFKQLKIEGFIVFRWFNQWPEGEQQMAAWIKEGKIKYKETITEGFENMYSAFRGLFIGSNTGKAIVKC